MISWMQKHKKWLIITIWISTFAFIGAGVVGWGAYSYGDKASAVAKVGDVEITVEEYQKTYAQLYNQFAQLFGSSFDKEKAKYLRLDKQALQKLINQALLINLAKEYDLSVSDKELQKAIIALPYFQTNGVFDKKLYKQLLSQNNLSIKGFEEGMRKDLLITKLMKLLPIKAVKQEDIIIDTKYNIADKISYKILSSDSITINPTQEELKTFWKTIKDKFKDPASYEIEYILQKPLTKSYDEKTLQEYYNENKTHFRGEDGKLLSFDKAKELVIQELNAKETKKAALKKYIAFKKGEIKAQKHISISKLINPFNGLDILSKLQTMTTKKPYLKPIAYNDDYIIIKLLATHPATIKSFEEAKVEVEPLYIAQKKKEKLLAQAQKEVKDFQGKTTDFVTLKTTTPLEGLLPKQSSFFLRNLFQEQTKQGFIPLDDETIVLYNILEQKLLTKTYNDSFEEMKRLKQTVFDRNFLKVLQNKYDIEIYKGL